MKIKSMLIALVIVAVACAGALAWNMTQTRDSEGSLVTSRPVGVAYAQDGGGGTPPPPAPPVGDAAAPAGDAAAADAAAAPAPDLTDEQWLAKLEEWKNSDPREIIEKKYDDLNAKKTDPSNEDDPANFIPETGRVDPLTIVSGAIPDELKPPRSGDTDANEVETYLFAEMASTIVDGFGANIEVYNVIQIGLTKIVSLTYFGQRDSIQEGGGGQFYWYSPEGWPVLMNLSCTKASSEEVVISISATPEGSNVNISKNFSFIPR